MAIDFGRAARGVATGYLQAKIKNTEANDQLKANVIERVGANFINEILPEVTQLEKNRKISYDRIKTEFGPNAAELADINNIITGDGKGYDNFKELMKTNKLNREKLDAVTFEGDYNTRFNQRGMDFQEKYQGIFDQIGIKQAGGLGPYTVESQLKEEKQKPPMSMMTTKDQMTDTVTQVPVEGEFGSTQLEEYMTAIGSDKFTESSQFRLRKNDTLSNLFSNVGLDGQFYSDSQGNIITKFDESDRNKGILVQELFNSRFTGEIARQANYGEVATKIATEIKALEAATVKFKTDTDALFLANKYSSGLAGANDDNTYTQFLLANQQLLSAYGKGTQAYKNFIKKRFNALVPSSEGYYQFFERFEREIEAEEN